MSIYRQLDKNDIYNIIYDYTVPLSFFMFISILILSSIYKNLDIFIYGMGIIILLIILFMIYMWLYPFEHLNERFELWVHSFKKYKLNNNEKLLFANLIHNSKIGYSEWYERTHGDDICGPWIKEYSTEEYELLEKIHRYYYGDHWYITMPISGAQVNYIMLQDIKDKVEIKC